MFISAVSIIYSRGRIPLSLALQSGRSSHTHTERITKHPQHWHTSRFVVAVFCFSVGLFLSFSCVVAFDVAVAVEAIDNGAHVSDACVKGFSLSASTWAKCRAFAVSYRKDSRQCGRVGRQPDCFSSLSFWVLSGFSASSHVVDGLETTGSSLSDRPFFPSTCFDFRSNSDADVEPDSWLVLLQFSV